MSRARHDLKDALAAIPPGALHYDDWLAVVQALHHEGYAEDVARDWTAQDGAADHRHRLDKLHYKWGTFGHEASSPVTGGTIVKLARDFGWEPGDAAAGADYVEYDDWTVTFEGDEPALVDATTVSEHDAEVAPVFPEGREADELSAYIRALFDESDIVRYVLDAEVDPDTGRAKPGVGVYKRTAGDVLKALEGGSIADALGDTDDEVGAYICINPLDGQYIGNKNVTAFRYALLESDEMPVGQFAAIVREMNLPVAATVHSGNKSLHAIVRVDAMGAEQYAERVRVLYERAARNGIIVDKANKNASRMSRLPGVTRKGRRQFLAGLAQGAGDWEEWEEWYAEATDDLPDAAGLDSMLGENLPKLKPELISGVLRVGHKMLVSGPSKAGKSFALIALCIAFACGGTWFGFRCRKSRVMYVNLELDGDSCVNRFNDMFDALKIDKADAGNIVVWNLRGKTQEMRKLLPKLVRRCQKTGVEVVVIDPIYKVMVGDENSAGDMAQFANLFDELCDKAGVSAIYCHHHSKGFQGDKRSIDRASGSGVFGRDPDAILDMVELDVDDGDRWKHVNDKCCKMCADAVADFGGVEADATWMKMPDVARNIEANALDNAKTFLDDEGYAALKARCEAAKAAKDALTAWRVEGTLREFPKLRPVNAWFDWPLHVVDGTLSECREVGAEAPKGHGRKNKSPNRPTASIVPDEPEKAYAEINNALSQAVDYCREDGVEPTRENVRQRMPKVAGKQPTKTDINNWTRENKSWSEWKTGGFAKHSARGEKVIVRKEP